MSAIVTVLANLFNLIKNMFLGFQFHITNNIQVVVNWVSGNWIFASACGMTTIICLLVSAIENPEGAINTFMKICIDLVVVPLPSTPDNFKLATLIAQFDNAFPVLGGGVISELLEGVVGLSVIFFSIKALRLLPFF